VVYTLYQLASMQQINPRIVTQAMEELGLSERASFAHSLR
jgi:hypothetical protein